MASAPVPEASQITVFKQLERLETVAGLIEHEVAELSSALSPVLDRDRDGAAVSAPAPGEKADHEDVAARLTSAALRIESSVFSLTRISGRSVLGVAGAVVVRAEEEPSPVFPSTILGQVERLVDFGRTLSNAIFSAEGDFSVVLGDSPLLPVDEDVCAPDRERGCKLTEDLYQHVSFLESQSFRIRELRRRVNLY